MAERKKTSASKWMITFTAVGVVIAVAVVAAAGLSRSKKNKPQELAKVQLKQEILSFSFQMIPEIYTGLVQLNNQILLIDKELSRLKEIEAEFPRQKTIINAERMSWTRVQNTLMIALSGIERVVEKIYVAHLINTNKGKELIGNEKKSLLETVKKALDASEPQIKRLRVVKKKTLIEQIREKLT